MSNPSGLEYEKQPPSPVPQPEADVEGGQTAGVGSSGFGIGSVLRRWRREDFMRKGSVVLRAMGLVFSLLSFIIMASNNHGDWKEFGKYEEYRYVNQTKPNLVITPLWFTDELGVDLIIKKKRLIRNRM